MKQTKDKFVKCYGSGCPIKQLCHRYTDPGDPVDQVFFSHAPFNFAAGKCDAYMTDKTRQ